MQFKISESYDVNKTLKKWAIYAAISLAVAFVILGTLPESMKISLAISIVVALYNFIKHSGLLGDTTLPDLPTPTQTNVGEVYARRKRK